MKKIPKISVLMPLYNHAEYVEKAMDSLLAQQGVAFEVIVVDDGSTDGGDKIIEEKYVSDRVQLVRQRRNGCGTTRALRRALQQSEGDFVCWLSSDDWYLPNKLADQYEAYRTTFGDTDGVLHAWPGYCSSDLEYAIKESNMSDEVVKQTFQKEGCVTWFQETQNPPQESQLFYFFLFNYINGITIFMPRHLFETHGAFSESFPITQDYEFWFRLAYHNVPFRVMPKATTCSLMHKGNLGLYRRDIPAETSVITRLYSELVRPEQLETERSKQGFTSHFLLMARLMQVRKVTDLEYFYLEEERAINALDSQWENRYQALRTVFSDVSEIHASVDVEHLPFSLGMYLSDSNVNTWRWYIVLTHFFEAFTVTDNVCLRIYVPATNDADFIIEKLEQAIASIENYLQEIPDLDLQIILDEAPSVFIQGIHAFVPSASGDNDESVLLYQARKQKKLLLYHTHTGLLQSCLKQYQKQELPENYADLAQNVALDTFDFNKKRGNQ